MTQSSVPPPLPKRSASLADYVKRAFLYRWNLLLFFGGTAAAFLTPWPDALLPLVAAAEVAYLGGIISLPRFRDAIDAQVHKDAKAAPAPAGGGMRTLQEIMATLPPESRRRFELVRTRCLEMRAIASGVRGRAGAAVEASQELSTSTLDRLLWVFLRLLVSRESLGRFLERTDADEIRARLAETKSQIEQHGGDERILRSLQDSLAAQELRLENYTRAESNHEYVRIELDRIEAKIHVLAESSVNRQDPDFLSSQIDSVTESVHSTEKAISELEQITGLVDEMQEPPAILESDLDKVTGS